MECDDRATNRDVLELVPTKAPRDENRPSVSNHSIGSKGLNLEFLGRVRASYHRSVAPFAVHKPRAARAARGRSNTKGSRSWFRSIRQLNCRGNGTGR
jgi:hypothetical protein